MKKTKIDFFSRGEAEHLGMVMPNPKHWNEYVGFDLNDEEVIEILAVISRMRGVARSYK